MTFLYWGAVAVILGGLLFLRRRIAALVGGAAAWVRKRPPLGLLLWSVPLALLALLLAWKGPEWQLASRATSLTPEKYLELQNSYRATIVQALGGLVLLIGIYLTWRRVAATEQQVEVAREEQITEGFTRAIEQLGSDKLEVRLGGIYALERIARDSERDHWPIMEVLTAYVREKARCSEDRPAEPPPLAADIQAILTVLGRRRVEFEDDRDLRLDLRNSDLRRADLRQSQLSRAKLSGANLERALLHRAQLAATDLTDAVLDRAGLVEASLVGARLERASLVAAVLNRAVLTEARLDGAVMRGCYLQGAILERASLQQTELTRASLVNAVLYGAYLTGATLDDASLWRADLTRARLGADPDDQWWVRELDEPSLRGTLLGRARLANADLRGVDLSQTTGLTPAQIESAMINRYTKLPHYLKQGGEGQPEAPDEGGEVEEEEKGEEEG